MSLKRTTIIFVGGAALAAWLHAAITPGRPPVLSDRVAPAPIDATGAELAAEINRLRVRLRPESAPGEPTRNPFAFRSRGGAESPSSAAARTNSENAASTTMAADTERLGLALAGVAADTGPDGPVRTAIISGNGQLFLAKEGDTVTDRDAVYRIGSISADSVELIDPRDGSTRRLTFK